MKKIAAVLTICMLMSSAAYAGANDGYLKQAIEIISKVLTSKEAQIQATRIARDAADSSTGRNWIGRVIANIRFKKYLESIWRK